MDGDKTGRNVKVACVMKNHLQEATEHKPSSNHSESLTQAKLHKETPRSSIEIQAQSIPQELVQNQPKDSLRSILKKTDSLNAEMNQEAKSDLEDFEKHLALKN